MKDRKRSSCKGELDREKGQNVNWASEASPTLGCSIEISGDIICLYVVLLSYVN